jgi:AGCS family alanine or glycine:cation symporter
MTSAAFESAMPWFKMVLSVAVILFAFSTMISWSYYGMQAWTFLFGKSRFMDLCYKFLFCAFIVIGSSMSLGKVVGFSDAMIFAMSVPNIIGLYLLLPVVRRELDDFRSHCAEIDSQS